MVHETRSLGLTDRCRRWQPTRGPRKERTVAKRLSNDRSAVDGPRQTIVFLRGDLGQASPGVLVLKSLPDQVLAVDAVPVPVEASARSNFVLPAAAFCRMELPEDPASTSIPSFRFAVTPLPVTVLLLDPVVSVLKWIPSCVLPTVLLLEIRFQPESINSMPSAPLLMVELLETVFPVVALVPADWSRMPFRALWLAPLLTTVLLLAVVKPAMEPAM